MKVCLSMWSVHKYWYDGTWSNVDFIDFAGTTNAEGVELLSVFWRDRAREIPLMSEALRRNNLDVACFSACNNLAAADPKEWKTQLQDIFDSVDAAVHFGAPVVRVFSGNKEGDDTFENAKARIIKGLTEAADYAKSHGVTLCLENHGLFAGKAKQVAEIISTVGSPALRSTFDTGNFLLVDEDPNDAIETLKPLVKHVHFKDFQRVKEDYVGESLKSLAGIPYVGKIAGQGQVDLPHILRELRSAGYNDWLTVEFEGEEEQKFGSIESVNYLHELLAQL